MKRKMRAAMETQVSHADGKNYICRLRRFSEQNPSPHIMHSDNRERVEVWELLDELNAHPSKYRRFQIDSPPFVLVEKQKLGIFHKIESVKQVNVGDPTPKVELWYKIDQECHGIVILYLKPRSAPTEFRNFLVDDEEMTNFTPSVVMSNIDAGMRDSVSNGTVNEIEWEVHETSNQPNSPLFRGEEWVESINCSGDMEDGGKR